MSKQKISVGCRILASTVLDVDEAAKGEGLTRAEWIANAIARQLGKRPRVPLVSRLNALEKRLAALEGKAG